MKRRGRQGPKTIGELLAKSLGRQALPVARELLEAAWRRVGDDALAGSTRVRGYRAGTLTIEVDCAALLQELAVFRKERLQEALRAGGPPLHELERLRFVQRGQRTGGGRRAAAEGREERKGMR